MQCQAYCETTGERCEKDAISGLRFCVRHYRLAKKPVGVDPVDE